MAGNTSKYFSDVPISITGIGLETPLASGKEVTWDRLIQGETGIRRCEFPTTGQSFFGAPACNINHDSPQEPTLTLALRAAQEAIDEASPSLGNVPSERIGCVIGTSKGGLHTFDKFFQNPDDPEADWFSFLPNASSASIAAHLGFHGPILCPVAACATGLIAMIRAVDLIREGVCDAVLAGSADASFLPIVVNSFRRLRVMADSHDGPETTCRPFDQHRSGFVVGEGAGLVLLQRSDLLETDQNIYANWGSGLFLSDTNGLMQVDSKAETLSVLLEKVIANAKVQTNEIDYVNFHGTGTKLNDKTETTGYKNVFGNDAYRFAGSSLKGAIGHLLGAAGSVELALTAMAVSKGVVPPTIHYETPDPECDLNYTPNEAVEKPIRAAIKTSLGFGGHLAAAILKSPDF